MKSKTELHLKLNKKELLSPEQMKLLRSTENKITKERK